VWLKRALSSSSGTSLVPRFHTDVFFAGSIEVPTQWQRFASREVSLDEGRCEYFGLGSTGEECSRVYERLSKDSYRPMIGRLNDGGLLVTCFA